MFKSMFRGSGNGGGGDQHNLGWYATQLALETAHPTATAGDWAIVGATDTVWIWDTDTSAWKDSDQKGQVTSVNNKTGTVVLNASDVDAVPQYSTMPTATAEMVGNIVQFTGTTNANYTNGYFYKATGTETIIPESTSPTIDQGFPFSDWTAAITAPNLIEDMNNEVSWGVAYFADRLENPDAIIYINYTIEFGEDPVIQSVMFEGATFTTPAVLSHFALTRVNKDSSGNGQMAVYPHYTPEHAEYTNTSWEQINVQPASAITTPATMPELTVAGWVNNIQTVNVDGVTTDNAVFVSPAPASVADYNAAGVVCTAQNNGTLTFTCTTTPSNAITVNVLIMG